MKPTSLRSPLLGLAVVLASGPSVASQEASKPAFTAAQLEQLAAPIALYPDGLLMQILMASTYPLEIVEADRWVRANPGKTGKALEEALKGRSWDPSVKSLCGFPDVLKRMSENLDWTRDLGDAFLAQQADLLDAVQRMRNKAYDAGNLKTTDEQTVTAGEDKIIVIESSDPQVIYVPTYYPTTVYGTWTYPTWYYPTLYAPPPPGRTGFAFAAGVAWGAAVWGDCDWGWGHSEVKVDVDHHYEFNRNTSVNAKSVTPYGARTGEQATWRHDAEHREGVGYRDEATARRHGATGAETGVTRAQARGYDPSRDGRGASTGSRELTSARPDASRDRSATSNRGTVRSTAAASGSRGSTGHSAWSGSRNADFDRAASSRGASSRTGSSGGGGQSRGGGASRGGRRR